MIQTEHPINVAALKSRIYDKEGIPEYLQRLTQQGKPLKNDQVLWSPNSSHYPSIDMNINLDGGAPWVGRNSIGARNTPAAPQQPPSSSTRIPRLPHSIPATPKLLPNTTTNWTFPLDTNGYANGRNPRYCGYRKLFRMANEELDECWGVTQRATKPNGCRFKFTPPRTMPAPWPRRSPPHLNPTTRTQTQITPTTKTPPTLFIPTNTSNTWTPSSGRRFAALQQHIFTPVESPAQPKEPNLLLIWSNVEKYPTFCIRAHAGWFALTLLHAISWRCGIPSHHLQLRYLGRRLPLNGRISALIKPGGFVHVAIKGVPGGVRNGTCTPPPHLFTPGNSSRLENEQLASDAQSSKSETVNSLRRKWEDLMVTAKSLRVFQNPRTIIQKTTRKLSALVTEKGTIFPPLAAMGATAL